MRISDWSSDVCSSDLKAPQEREMRLAPGGDVIVVVAVGDRAADRQQQHLRQRTRHTPRIARVLDLRKMLQKRSQPRLRRERRRDRAPGTLRSEAPLVGKARV